MLQRTLVIQPVSQRPFAYAPTNARHSTHFSASVLHRPSNARPQRALVIKPPLPASVRHLPQRTLVQTNARPNERSSFSQFPSVRSASSWTNHLVTIPQRTSVPIAPTNARPCERSSFNPFPSVRSHMLQRTLVIHPVSQRPFAYAPTNARHSTHFSASCLHRPSNARPQRALVIKPPLPASVRHLPQRTSVPISPTNARPCERSSFNPFPSVRSHMLQRTLVIQPVSQRPFCLLLDESFGDHSTTNVRPHFPNERSPMRALVIQPVSQRPFACAPTNARHSTHFSASVLHRPSNARPQRALVIKPPLPASVRHLHQRALVIHSPVLNVRSNVHHRPMNARPQRALVIHLLSQRNDSDRRSCHKDNPRVLMTMTKTNIVCVVQ
ncbi:hypothetical protein LR48_Vigan09g168200 [Vigna angularis]|uniref:Uncharacterized protein n=1 Tax=Phaseolus angularis TaxID=3914 RepID=A0A0L9VDE6_PHAAN|nr:hypothetical protein LR48_Vigan09g168200 [Vigna angularis]